MYTYTLVLAYIYRCTDYNTHSREKALQLIVAISDKSDPDVLAAVMTKVFKESDELPLYARLAAVQAVPAGAMFFCPYSPLVEGTCASAKRER